MALTPEQIDEVIEKLYLDPTKSITLADGRQVTRYDVNQLLELKKAIESSAKKGTIQDRTFIKVKLVR